MLQTRRMLHILEKYTRKQHMRARLQVQNTGQGQRSETMENAEEILANMSVSRNMPPGI